MKQRFLEIDLDTLDDTLWAAARTAQKIGLPVAVVVARDPGVVTQARNAANAIGGLDVETTITASTIKVCFRTVPPATATEPWREWIHHVFHQIKVRGKRSHA